MTDELEQLAQLKEQGIINDQEFEAKKTQILGLSAAPTDSEGSQS